MFNIDDDDEEPKLLNIEHFYVSYFDSVAQLRIYYYEVNGLFWTKTTQTKVPAHLVDNLTKAVMRVHPTRNITVEPCL